MDIAKKRTRHCIIVEESDFFKIQNMEIRNTIKPSDYIIICTVKTVNILHTRKQIKYFK